MARQPNPLIESMVADLQPVHRLTFREGLVFITLAVLTTVLAVELIVGLWRGAWLGEASAFYVMTNGLLFVLGCASTHCVLQMNSPRVGGSYHGPKWTMAMVAVLPAAALATLLGHEHDTAVMNRFSLPCFGAALLASLLNASVLFVWLRRGATVSPKLAGLYLGVAATAFGSAAYGLACPLDDVVHLGVWHVMPVLVGGLVGRFLLPPLLRW